MVVDVGNAPTRHLRAIGYQPIPFSYQAIYDVLVFPEGNDPSSQD